MDFVTSLCIYYVSQLTVSFALLRKPCSGYKLKEMTGSGIFKANGGGDASESGASNPINKTSVRVYQVLI